MQVCDVADLTVVVLPQARHQRVLRRPAHTRHRAGAVRRSHHRRRCVSARKRSPTDPAGPGGYVAAIKAAQLGLKVSSVLCASGRTGGRTSDRWRWGGIRASSARGSGCSCERRMLDEAAGPQTRHRSTHRPCRRLPNSPNGAAQRVWLRSGHSAAYTIMPVSCCWLGSAPFEQELLLMRLALQTACIERRGALGGTCLNVGWYVLFHWRPLDASRLSLKLAVADPLLQHPFKVPAQQLSNLPPDDARHQGARNRWCVSRRKGVC